MTLYLTPLAIKRKAFQVEVVQYDYVKDGMAMRSTKVLTQANTKEYDRLVGEIQKCNINTHNAEKEATACNKQFGKKERKEMRSEIEKQ